MALSINVQCLWQYFMIYGVSVYHSTSTIAQQSYKSPVLACMLFPVVSLHSKLQRHQKCRANSETAKGNRNACMCEECIYASTTNARRMANKGTQTFLKTKYLLDAIFQEVVGHLTKHFAANKLTVNSIRFIRCNCTLVHSSTSISWG